MNKHIFAIILISFLCFISAKAGVTPPVICPEPAFIEAPSSEYHPLQKVSIACPDKGALAWAETHLKEWYGAFSPEVSRTNGWQGSLEGDAYEMEVGNKDVQIKAKTLQGVRYALYSLRQIAIPKRGTKTVEGWIVPEVVINDLPGMDFRGIHICWFHETEPWEVERLVRLAAYYKLNYAVIESWGTFRSDIAPWFGWPDGTMTKQEVARLKAIADDLGITLIPQINVFGHATMARSAAGKHAVLDLNPEYQPLFEPLGGWNWCLSNPEARKLLQEMITEQYEAFGRPPYFHIGGDEALPPSCPDCLDHPFAELFLDHIKAMNETITSLGAKTMMWHDMLLEGGDKRWEGFYANGTHETAAGFLEFPKDIVICDWFYGGAKDAYPTLDYFKAMGFPVMTCPWKDWNGTVSQGKYAHKKQLDGILGTLWHHYFGNDLIRIYYPLANVAWKPDFTTVPNVSYHVYNHLRQVGWDMKVSDPRHTGIYYDEIPPEPELDN